ncbi:MAG: hypothetical protein K0S61_3015 [Anaerocolumna sp.]|jgi:hypothetical protein|nr:hypothetical protein [Anaerocolumna sp.]
MEPNILSGGRNDLLLIKEKLVELNTYRDRRDDLSSKESSLEKTIKTKEKEITEEINNTIRQRKDEIEAAYNSQIESTRQRSKKIKGKKEKSKSLKVSERIDNETSGLREECRLMKQEIKDIFRMNKIPRIYNNRLFYSIFTPKGFGDLSIIIIVLLLLLLALPYGIYANFLSGKNMVFLFLVYVLIVVVFGGAYLLIENNVRARYAKAFLRITQIRVSLILNQRKRNSIQNGILKDKDESVYGLDNFNEELKELEDEILVLNEQRKEAMNVFESSTKLVIKDEITARHLDELNGFKKDYGIVYVNGKDTEDSIRSISMDITNNFEVFMGKEFMSAEKLDALYQIMEEQNLNTISEAIGYYKGEK